MILAIMVGCSEINMHDYHLGNSRCSFLIPHLMGNMDALPRTGWRSPGIKLVLSQSPSHLDDMPPTSWHVEVSRGAPPSTPLVPRLIWAVKMRLRYDLMGWVQLEKVWAQMGSCCNPAPSSLRQNYICGGGLGHNTKCICSVSDGWWY